MSGVSGWAPSGLSVFEEAVSETVEAVAISLVDREMERRSASVQRDSRSGGRGRLLRLGYDQSGEPIGDAELPSWSRLIQSLLYPKTLTRFDSIIICEYQPGDGIGAHADSPVYVGSTAALCLGADATLTMRPRPTHGVWSSESYSVAIPRRSLYVMTGEALERCTHEIETSARGERRVSVIFRSTKIDGRSEAT